MGENVAVNATGKDVDEFKALAGAPERPRLAVYSPGSEGLVEDELARLAEGGQAAVGVLEGAAAASKQRAIDVLERLL